MREAPYHITTPVPTPLRTAFSDAPFVGSSMPSSLFGFVWRVSAWDQAWLSLLAVVVSLLGMAPVELQRQIVNEAVKQKNLDEIYKLAIIYAALALTHGLTKLLFNLYKGWISANTSRLLRLSIGKLVPRSGDIDSVADMQGVEISMIVSECDAIGGFTSECITEPVLEGGTLVVAFGYMLILQPSMAILSLVIFIPQAIIVPIVQRAINRKVSGRIKTLRKAGGDLLAYNYGTSNQQAINRQRFGAVFRFDVGVFVLKSTLNFLMNLCQHFGTVIVLALGAWFVVHGQTQVGTVVAFLSSLGHVTDPWGAMVGWFQTLTLSGAKYELVRLSVARLHQVNEAAADESCGTNPPLQTLQPSS